MALTTRPRPKSHAKKRQAKHHRHGKLYMKPYWPYLPLLAVSSLGYFADRHWPASLVKIDTVEPTTRIQALSGNQNTWSLAMVIAMAGMAAAIFIVRYWYRVHRVINRGELFVITHPWFDVVLLSLAAAGVLLTRSTL